MSTEVRGSAPPLTGYGDALSSHPSTVAYDSLLGLVAVLIGMSLALDRFVPVQVGDVTPTFVLAVAFGTLGYWIGVTDPVMRRFLAWVAPFTVWAVVSVLTNANASALKTTAGILVWLLLLPGIASMCLDRRRWRALMFGLVIGASVLLSVVVWRFARGTRLLDVNHFQLLGVNRNAIDMSIVWLVPPVLWSKTLGIPRLGRHLFLAAAVLWLVSSQGRTGLIALLLVPPVYLILKPSSAFSRVTRLALVALIGALLYVALTTISIPGLPATQRIVQFERGNRSNADQIRLLLNEKSLALARKHSVTGVGFGLYEGQYDPVVEKAPNDEARKQVLTLPGHNTYYEVLATTGVPGFVFFVGALLVPFFAGIRHSDDQEARALTTGLVIVLFCITFHTSYGTILYLPVVATMAAAARARRARIT